MYIHVYQLKFYNFGFAVQLYFLEKFELVNSTIVSFIHRGGVCVPHLPVDVHKGVNFYESKLLIFGIVL